MERTRAAVAVGFGAVAIAVAVTAVTTDHLILVAIAALLALASAFVASEAGWRLLTGRSSRAQLEEATARLEEERRAALEQANRYQAEAVKARQDLAAAMRAPDADDDPSPAIDEGRAPASPPAEVQTDRLLDSDTGVFSELFFIASLEKRVSAARRGMRHLSVAVVDVVTDLDHPRPTPADPKLIAATMTAVFRDADTIARADDGTFLLLFEDTPETGAVWTMERFRRQLTDNHPDHTTWVGISSYPAYGFTAEQLLIQASDALDRAREWKQDRIEVTDAAPEA